MTTVLQALAKAFQLPPQNTSASGREQPRCKTDLGKSVCAYYRNNNCRIKKLSLHTRTPEMNPAVKQLSMTPTLYQGKKYVSSLSSSLDTTSQRSFLLPPSSLLVEKPLGNIRPFIAGLQNWDDHFSATRVS